ncbi:unnamed protein product, partial [Brassica oleracea]
EQIINELNEATLLYLNCPDPTEAAARRQRVLAGDAKGQTEETAAGLLRLRGAPGEHRGETLQNHHNPVTVSKEQILQELQEVTKQYLSFTPPPAMKRIETNQKDVSILRNQTNRAMEGIYPERLKSIVVSPKGVMGGGAEAAEGAVEVADDEETLQNFQSKAKRRPIKLKPTVASPKQLAGASSKKRILSLVQHSPGRAKRSLGAGPPRGKNKQHGPNIGTGP